MLLLGLTAFLAGVAVGFVTDLVVMPFRRQSAALAGITVRFVTLARPMPMLLKATFRARIALRNVFYLVHRIPTSADDAGVAHRLVIAERATLDLVILRRQIAANARVA
jgi:hypothetical protein